MGIYGLVTRRMLRKQNAKFPVALAIVGVIGMNNIVYAVWTVVNMCYYAYYCYSVLKKVAVGTVSWTVDPIARGIHYISEKLNYKC